ncbi:hypothetical protein TNCV_970311 [Trichonephila clavipes]|nr:hypothetical protein TNCV_970311 [Trichonephila clavipes]
MCGSGNSDNVEKRGWNERRMSNADDSRINGRNLEVLRCQSNRKNDYMGNYENGWLENQWFNTRNRYQREI